MVIQKPLEAASRIPRATSWARISVIQSRQKAQVHVGGRTWGQMTTTDSYRPSEVRVSLSGLTCTVDRTEASRATFSVARPAKKLSSGIGTVIPLSQST